MRSILLSFTLMAALPAHAWAWGQEGHSIIAEIAQRRLTPEAATAVTELLGPGHSLASIASWADDVKDLRPETYNWHFVDIPLAAAAYDPARDCQSNPAKGDCVVAEIDRLANEVRCATDAARADALKFAVHFIGDVHQPLHTVSEDIGGNTLQVDLFTRGLTCTGTCQPRHTPMNFHMVWDTGLIDKTVWDWGAYVDALEGGWLKSSEAQASGIDGGTPAQWASETHKAAQTVWNLVPADKVLDDA